MSIQSVLHSLSAYASCGNWRHERACRIGMIEAGAQLYSKWFHCDADKIVASEMSTTLILTAITLISNEITHTQQSEREGNNKQ